MSVQRNELEDDNDIKNISLVEADNILEEQNHQTPLDVLGEIVDERVNIDYSEIKEKVLLSDKERNIMWDKYKYFVDEAVFIELQYATLCR